MDMPELPEPPANNKKPSRKPRAKPATKPLTIRGVELLWEPAEPRIAQQPNGTWTNTVELQYLTDDEKKLVAGDKPATTTSTIENNIGNEEGDVPFCVAETSELYGAKSLEFLPLARARDGESKSQCWERLRREGRASGMTRKGAIAYAAGVIDGLFPPPPPPEPEIVEEEPAEILPPEPPPIEAVELPQTVEPPPSPVDPVDMGVSGLGDMPADWPTLPANAQLQVEISWVSANRLRVRSGSGVDLSRALSPAPSYSALSWLETSILFPSKFADISVKATAQQDDEWEGIRREKLAIEEIRGLLAEMLEG